MSDAFQQLWKLFEIWIWRSRHQIEDSEYERPYPIDLEFVHVFFNNNVK